MSAYVCISLFECLAGIVRERERGRRGGGGIPMAFDVSGSLT